MSLWFWFRTLAVTLVAVSLGLNQTAVRAVSQAAGSDSGLVAVMAHLSTAATTAFGQCKKLLGPVEPTPTQQLREYAYGKTMYSPSSSPEILSKMQMVGMKEFKAVQRMEVPRNTVREKIHRGLQAKGVPGHVAEVIGLQLEGAHRFQDQFDDFQVDDSGSAHLYRVIIRMLCEEMTCDIALAATGASFNAAKEIDHYETQETPEYEMRARVIDEYEDHWNGRYHKTKTVYEKVQIGTKVNKIPVMKQKTFTANTMEDVKNYLEGKAMKEVLLLAPPPNNN